jgi:hypothetical protein
MFKVRKLVDDDVLEHPFRGEYEAHGGRLWATRCEPRGALFQFTIPADSAAIRDRCRLLARNGHGMMSDSSPLSGVERKTSAPDEYFAF